MCPKSKAAVALGRLGGVVSSMAKAEAARLNGARGGRPRKGQETAHARLNAAVRRGDIVKPKTCPGCGRAKRRIEAHHVDHENPLSVEWFCSECHGELRRRLLMWGDMPVELRARVRARVEREGVSVRALILSLLTTWVEA